MSQFLCSFRRERERKGKVLLIEGSPVILWYLSNKRKALNTVLLNRDTNHLRFRNP